MKCPKCGGRTKISNSRDFQNGTKRTHDCIDCHNRFFTIEIEMSEYKLLLEWKEKFNTMVSLLKGGVE